MGSEERVLTNYIKIKEFRNRVKKSQRMIAWAVADYSCQQCEITIPFQVCLGVGVRGDDMPLREIDCPACEDPKGMIMASLTPIIPAEVDSDRWVLRVPSRRAAVAIARSGELNPQIVRPRETAF